MNAFDNSDFEKHKAEAKEKWGKTEAYKEYEEKTKSYSNQKWSDLVEGLDHIMAEFALCLKNDETPDCVTAQELVKTLQDYITENYYLCTNEILAGLGQMYVADERFTKNIDKHADGTAEFICQAIKVYCNK
ncbi:MAG: TipAS antibiotic-recognition domain-containing protein [Ruminococcus sp.]|nr:TipAS antibiotic-recognition domain-containing protein [Ruminococcus sp.]